LLFTSITALALIIERAWATREETVCPDGLLDLTLARTHKPFTADDIAVLAEGSLLGLVLAGGIACRQRDRDHLREALEVAGHRAAASLEKNLSLLSMIATIAPLMGLLGTVVGMIEVFGSQTSLGADPQALAHGISVALYNTAFGLVIAIPAAIAHRFFRIRADSYLQQLEDAARLLLDKLAVARARTTAAPAPGSAPATGSPQASQPYQGPSTSNPPDNRTPPYQAPGGLR
jgi:biopolymer transport protein ExbB